MKVCDGNIIDVRLPQALLLETKTIRSIFTKKKKKKKKYNLKFT